MVGFCEVFEMIFQHQVHSTIEALHLPIWYGNSSSLSSEVPPISRGFCCCALMTKDEGRCRQDQAKTRASCNLKYAKLKKLKISLVGFTLSHIRLMSSVRLET